MAVKVEQQSSGAFKQISVGGVYACGVNYNDEAYCWGNNQYGQLGHGDKGNIYKTPVKVSLGQIPVGEGISYISVSKDNPNPVGQGTGQWSQQTCAVSTGGKVYCWGGNIHGGVGVGNFESDVVYTSPQKVITTSDNANSELPSNETMVSVSAGSQQTCALGVSGRIYCWGYNNHGQLGVGNTINYAYPRLVVGNLLFSNVITGFDNGGSGISLNPGLSCGLAINNDLYCWGDNRIGQVGIGGSSSPITSPRKVLLPTF